MRYFALLLLLSCPGLSQEQPVIDYYKSFNKADNPYIFCVTGYDNNLASKGIYAPIYDQACVISTNHSLEQRSRDTKHTITDGITRGLSGISQAITIFKFADGVFN